MVYHATVLTTAIGVTLADCVIGSAPTCYETLVPKFVGAWDNGGEGIDNGLV